MTTEAHGFDLAQVKSLISSDGLVRIESLTGDIGICTKCIGELETKVHSLARGGDDCDDKQEGNEVSATVMTHAAGAGGVLTRKSSPQEWVPFQPGGALLCLLK